MKTKITILLLSGIFICRFSFSQSNSFSTEQTKQTGQFIKFDEASAIALAEFPTWASTYFKLSEEYKFELINSAPDNLGMVHYRYRQTCNGIPLEGTTYIVHTKNGKITSMNGEVFNQITSNKMPALSEQAALSNALADINASLYKWQVPEEESQYKLETKNAAATYFPQGELVYAAADGKFRNENFRLAWKFDIYAVEPLSRNYVYVDAITGYVISKQSRIHDVDSYGTAITAYSGSQTIATENYLGSYRLRETGRGGGINTYNMLTGTTYANAVDFTDADNLWNNVNPQRDQYATDAHWGAEMTYDYYLTRHNRHSIDNANFPLNSYVHYGVNYSNAFWDGQRMTYGDGGGSYNPFTALDITGHEITHGVTSFSSNLNYSYESGALNESFSDIFGTAIEFFARPSNANWLIGSDIGVTIRNMANPNATGGPDTYGGLYWATGPGDNGGVHTNSQVQNFWFYLLAQGGAGTNDIGNSFSVTGIGIVDAAAIAYRTNCFYLTSISQYADARFYSIQSAADLFGLCSQQVTSTTNAWYAVGVGTASPFNIVASGPTTFCSPGSVTLSENTGTGITFQWRLNGINISGATASSYMATASGNYDCIVSNACHTSVTNSIAVTAGTPFTASVTAGGPTTFCMGSNVTLSASPAGAGYTFQWRKNSINITGATASSYTATLPGNYDVVISYAGCTAISNVITTTVTGLTILTLQPNAANGSDAVIGSLSSQSNVNYGNTAELNALAWTVSGIPALQRGLIRFDLSTIPTTSTVLQANLFLFNNPNSSNGNPAGSHSNLSGSNASWLQKITQPWNENTVTWNNQPASTTVNQVTVPQSTSPHQDYNIDATTLVQDMVSNPATNFGFLLRLQTESYYRALVFATSDYSDSTRWPRLVIYYGSSFIANITASGPTTFYAPGSVILNANTGPGLSYQWRLNSVNISGATSSSYSASSSGNYDCIVSSSTCSATSNSITVTVVPPPATPDWLWAKRIGAIGADHGSVTAVDASGNIYLAGTFTGTVDFDPGPGTFNLTSAGSPDIFISKLDGGGNFIWAKQMGGYGFQDVLSIVLDNAGNIYTAGYFAGTSDFDPGPGIFNLTSLSGYPDVFISKLDNTGNFIWARQFTGAQSDFSSSLVIDASANVYTTGSFQGTVDFDPGAGTFNMTSAGNSDIYVSKLDASGNFVWAKQLGSTGNDEGHAIKIDGSGNIYYTGVFNGTVDFDPGTGVFNLTSAGSDDIFISKLDNSGNFVWAKGVGGFYQDGSNAIAIGPGGYIYTTGYFQTTVDFDPGAGVFNLAPAGMGDIFILKLDASGNFVWAKQLGGPGPDEGRSITIDPTNGDVYTEGNFSVTADFDPGIGTFSLFSNGMNDFFVSKLDANGNFIWAKAAGGTLNDSYESSITLSPSGNIHLTGRFRSPTIAFGLTTLTNASNNEDIFLAKLDNSVLPPGAIITANGPTSFCSSGSVTLNATTGAGLSYQWRKNNANIAGATASSYVASSTGYYECLVSNSTGSSISNLIVVHVPAGPPLAVITAGPYGSTNCWPNGVMLTANADTGITYQWRQSGVPITGATSISYVPQSSNNYDCIITNVCGGTTSNTITVVYYTSPPSAVITAAGPTTFCAPGLVILNANTGLGFSYQWKLNSANITGATNSSYTAATGGNYTCIVSNQCGGSTSNAITVTVTPLPAAAITSAGPTTFCAAGSVTLNANTGAGLSYQWRLNGTNISGATYVSYSAFLAGNYDCVVTNSCGSATSNAITVTVVNSAPATPGSITGQATGVCSSTKTYSISSVPGATSYTWTVPSGATISSGQGTISVNVIFTSSFGSGNVSVVATNICGSGGSSSLAVSGAPAQPGNITGPSSVCHNQNNVIYSIIAITGATSYTWTVPPGTQIKNGQGTTQIRVRFGNSAGNITVRANNACGSGPIHSLAIAMPCRDMEETTTAFDVTLYPNPATDKLYVICNTLYGNESIEVFSDVDARIFKSEIQNPKSEIEISMLPSGIYFAEIISGEQKKVLKFIKQQ